MRRIDVEYFLEEVLVSTIRHALIFPMDLSIIHLVHCQLPCMSSFPGPNSVLVLDNAPVDHGGRIAQLCANAEVLLIYLPPYSPDLNPIEKVFSVLKSQLKRHHILTGTGDDPRLIKEFLPSFITPALMTSLFLGSGYAA